MTVEKLERGKELRGEILVTLRQIADIDKILALTCPDMRLTFPSTRDEIYLDNRELKEQILKLIREHLEANLRQAKLEFEVL